MFTSEQLMKCWMGSRCSIKGIFWSFLATLSSVLIAYVLNSGAGHWLVAHKSSQEKRVVKVASLYISALQPCIAVEEVVEENVLDGPFLVSVNHFCRVVPQWLKIWLGLQVKIIYLTGTSEIWYLLLQLPSLHPLHSVIMSHLCYREDNIY